MRPEEKAGQTHCKGHYEADPLAIWGQKTHNIHLGGITLLGRPCLPL